MPTTISADGVSEAIYLRMSGVDVEYSIGSLTTPASYTIIPSWPVNIQNTNAGPSTILRVVVTEALTISGSTGGNLNGYLAPITQYITFDGSGNTITFSGLSSYRGFLENPSQSYIAVQNFILNVDVVSALSNNAGWLCRYNFGAGGASGLSITNCTNNGDISALNSGGIAGSNFTGTSSTITNCTNNGNISGIESGGITGTFSGLSSGSVTITNCANNGSIDGSQSGGIVGPFAAGYGGLVTIRNCYSTGTINGQYSGGIAGSKFAFDTSQTCKISSCYSIGDISGNNAGGITGADIGYSDNATYTAVVDISNCYSLGAISTTTGGICGGWSNSAYTTNPTINLRNSYSSGAISGTGSGLLAATLNFPQIFFNPSRTYVANGTWSDTNAKASNALLGTPVSVTDGNPGTTWTTLATNTPFILSSYTSQLYSPNSASSSVDYTTTPGLFQDGGVYAIVNVTQSNNVAYIRPIVYKGTSPKYYAYNSNTFTFTSLNGALGPMDVSINSSTGVLNILLATSILVDGSTNYISLRMNTGIIEYSIDQSIYTPIPQEDMPLTIVNTNPGASKRLRVVFTESLTISNTYGDNGYFIAGSEYITFDGAGYNIVIDSVLLYPGFINNGGNQNDNGFANIVVQNINTSSIGSVSLPDYAGWLCQMRFGRGVSGNSLINCTNTIPINAFYSGGIMGYLFAYSGSGTITNCTNTGTLNGLYGGGIIGGGGAIEGGLVIITNCTNNGVFGAGNLGCGGIAGGFSAQGANTSLTITGCTNNAVITGVYSGGIIGAYAAAYANTALVSIINCTNTGNTGGTGCGGIAGAKAATQGTLTLTNCFSTGDIDGGNSGGIIGTEACESNGKVTITKCFSTGNINGDGSGGITGDRFAFNTNQVSLIAECYSTGDISGNNTGGITGADIRYNNTSPYNAGFVDISNCYSVGLIRSGAGGICGGATIQTYRRLSTIRITNSYSYGTLVDASSGLVAISALSKANLTFTTTNTYVAAGTWTDASANDSGALLGYPTDVSTNNPGTTWATYGSNTPYIFSFYNAAIYSPNSVSSFSYYTTSPGLFGSSSGYTYTLVNNSQLNNVATARVLVAKGTAPNYYSYNLNTFTLTSTNGLTGPITASINSSTGALHFIVPYPCFLEGTNILCFENNQLVYRPIEGLRKGDLVKTINNGYQPVHMIGTTTIYNPGNDYRITNRLYKCSTEKYPDLFEDLYITGCHSILVPWMTPDQWENTKAVNGDVFVTDDHFRLIACADEKAEPYNKEGFVNIYHIALEHREYYMNYGIYANGLLVESCSKRYLMELSNMRILGVNDTIVSEKVEAEAEAEKEENVFHKMPKLIDIC